MKVMYDAIDVQAMPKDGDIYAGYVDGAWPTFHSLADAYPGKQYVSITCFGRANTMVCDCETGDLSPTSAASWAHAELAAGRRPTIYTSQSNVAAVAQALGALGLMFVHDVDLWVAHYDGVAQIPAGTVAKQYQSTDSYDVSVTVDAWPSVAPAPVPDPPQEESMPGVTAFVTTSDNTRHRASIVYPGVLMHSWQGVGRPWQHENVAEVAGNSATPPSAPIAALTFVDQVPTCQVSPDGETLTIAAQTAAGSTSFEFVQVHYSGWGASEIV